MQIVLRDQILRNMTSYILTYTMFIIGRNHYNLAGFLPPEEHFRWQIYPLTTTTYGDSLNLYLSVFTFYRFSFRLIQLRQNKFLQNKEGIDNTPLRGENKVCGIVILITNKFLRVKNSEV